MTFFSIENLIYDIITSRQFWLFCANSNLVLLPCNHFCIAISRYLRFCETNELGNMPRSGAIGRKREKDLEKQGKLIIFAPFFK